MSKEKIEQLEAQVSELTAKATELQQKNENLSAKLKESEEHNQELLGKIDALNAELVNAQKQIEELSKKADNKLIGDLKKQIESLEAKNKELIGDNQEIVGKLAAAEKNTEKAGLRVVKDSEGNQYRLGAKKFKFQGADISFDELKNDSSLVDKLIEKKTGLLTLLS